MTIELLSVELTNKCRKACEFCYNASASQGQTIWTADTLTGFVESCAAHGLKAVSLGGGDPLEVPELLEDVLHRLQGTVFRTLTTSGLLLDASMTDRLVASRPDKVHVSIHFPERAKEVARVIRQVLELAERGLRSGVNLLVRKTQLEAAKRAVGDLHAAGVGNDRIVFLPMRDSEGRDTPSPQDIAAISDGKFQSMSCLVSCGRSPRFVSVSYDQTVAFCSYTQSRRKLPSLTWEGLHEALNGLDLKHCSTGLVRLTRNVSNLAC